MQETKGEATKGFCESCKWHDYTEYDEQKGKMKFFAPCFIDFLVGHDPDLEKKYDDACSKLSDPSELGSSVPCPFYNYDV